MVTKTENRLWRVEWCHVSGNQAPYQVVEAKTYQDAHALARAIPNRLAAFKNEWSFRLRKLAYKQNKRKQWVTPAADGSIF